MKKIIAYIIAIVIIGLLVWPKLKQASEAKPINNFKNKATPVTTQTVILKNKSQTINTTGNVMAYEEVVLYPETQGRVTQITFTEGSLVSQNQLLIKLNDADLQAQLKKALSHQKLKHDFELRNKTLLAKGAISEETYTISQNELQAINADVDLLREQIRKTEIRAPFIGQIGLRNISVGSYVTPTTKIAAIQNIQQLKIEFTVPEKYTHEIQKGSIINFKTDGETEPMKATIYAIEPKIDDATRNLTMRAVYKNTNNIFPGSFALINLPLQGKMQCAYIPTQAIVPILKGHKVFVAQGDSAIERKVKIGMRNDETIEILEGLSQGEQIIVDGVMYLKQGSKITVTKNGN